MGKLKASTLVEAILAMVIISIAFGLGMMVLEQNLNTNRYHEKIRAKQLLTVLRKENQYTSHWMNETVEREGFRIEKKISSYQEYQEVFELHFRVYDRNGHLLIKERNLIYEPK